MASADDRIHPSNEGRLINPSDGITGSTLTTEYALRRYILCGVTGTYRVYGAGGTAYLDTPMVQGGLYPFLSTKITTTGDAATTAGEVVAFR